MRVLLVAPTSLYKYRYPAFLSNTDFPTGFPYLAAALRHAGHEVFGLNPNNITGYRSAFEMLSDRLRRVIAESQPDLIGVGGLCIDYQFLADATKVIRNAAPDVPIVCGGGIVTYDSTFALQTLRPDFCVIGEGEEVLVRLADELASGHSDFGSIPNLGYWKDGVARFTERGYGSGMLDDRPLPDWDTFGLKDMLDNYAHAARYLFRYTRPNPRPMTVVAARSCPFRCTFCVHTHGEKYRARSIPDIMREIAYLHDRYRFNILLILDELFAVSGTRLREFASAVLDGRRTLGWDFDWIFQTHASAAFTVDDLKLARAAGCYFFSYGLESASPIVLASMKKKTKPAQIRTAVAHAHEAKIGFGGNFIFGDVAETAVTVAETIEFFTEVFPDDHVFVTNVQPYPGSKLFDICLDRGIIRDKLKYYEHIDETITNMTSMPDLIWIPWVSRLNAIGESFSWVKAADNVRWDEESATTVNPTGAHSDGKMFRIWAQCPHCGEEGYFRELVANPKLSKPSWPRIARYMRRSAELLWRGRHRLFADGILLARDRRIQRMFSLLEDLKRRPPIEARWFVTGCPHCNLRFRINLGDRGRSSIPGSDSRRA